MAIKKGAFQQYAQERKLPEKGQTKTNKKSHFFEDIYEEINGSQSVHNNTLLPEPKILSGEAPSNTENFKDIENKNNKKLIESKPIQPFHKQDNFKTLDKLPIQFQKEEKIEEISFNLNSQRDCTSEASTTFSRLVGVQREVIIALYKNMKVNKSDTTEELTLKMIANLAEVNYKSLKNTLFRLTSSGILSRVDQKSGRGGWVKYKINEQIVNELQETLLLSVKKSR
ncbi:hypothetical protein ACNVED_16810 (plasmid) [Legionella sp. D16C41]|uniref:hypothetical protein n=1 Tax=Legionella sp. D16C41 TaxID=3402688 RepID=UPI003AF7684F